MKKIYVSLLLSCSVSGTIAQPTIGFSSYITGLSAPVDIVHAHDGSNRLFIVQQNGIIRIHNGSSLVTRPFLNMSALVTYSGEQGLLSMAFHPKYASNRYFFVWYNNTSGSLVLAQYRTSATDSDSADTASRRILMTIAKPTPAINFTNHNGCKLNFGPDSNLYFAPGDGGSGGDPNNNAQNLNSLLGKMLRINVDSFNNPPYYTVPASNPLVGMSNTQPEIYAWGLRNPWRWSFDRATGDMWIADVGQGAWEEVNMVPAAGTSGLNYGWRCYEGNANYDLSLCGTTPATGKTFPVFVYPHSSLGGFAVTGGLVYRGAQYPALQGYYICADYVTTNGWLIKQNGATWTIIKQTNFPSGVSTFGDGEDSSMYLATLSGTVYKINVAAPLPATVLHFSASVQGSQDVLLWSATSRPALQHYEVEQSIDGEHLRSIANVPVSVSGMQDYRFTTASLPVERFYRLKMVYNDGNAEYSATARLQKGEGLTRISISAEPGKLWLRTPVALQKAILYNTGGQIVQQFGSLGAGTHALDLGNAVGGIYVLRCMRTDNTVEHLRLCYW